jgi:Fe-S-cluster-containing dehydrogenase component/formate-dependent nitrite reductase membrane component NrfD
VRYGFAIDHRTCIGCHACTVACKVEHDIPVGQFRTWVKYVDSGTFPDTTRDFGVMRCNHCTDAPCVEICPTSALFKRDDGIVDFDSDACIGCKACMQACPYDAIYIDKATNTAAKCNFCAHRVDNGLEPACVTVCPTHSIWVGDLEDPESGISRLVAENDTAVRAPEQRTGPNVHYVGAAPAVLDPLAAPVKGSYLWSQPDDLRLLISGDNPDADPDTVTTLNTAHPRPWGWRVASYLWTKGVAAGALLVAVLSVLLGDGLAGPIEAAPTVAVIGTAVTGVLLVWDLKRPERFLYLLTRPNTSSWLVKGGWCLMAIAAVSGVWMLAQLAGLDEDAAATYVLAALAVPAAVLAAGYTAFLFAQAEGRDLWQSRWLLPDLLAQAVLAGAGMLAIGLVWTDGNGPGRGIVALGILVGAAAHVSFTLAELLGSHETKGAEVAARILLRGRYAPVYWGGTVAVGVVAAALALTASFTDDTTVPVVVAGVLAQVAVISYEVVYVRAGQEVPLS